MLDCGGPNGAIDPPTHMSEQKFCKRLSITPPQLVPLVGHRYIPSEPSEAGNPVFSIHQSDVIYYGVDLAHYFERELGASSRPIAGPIKHIRFWSDLVERAYQAPFYRECPPG
jgi:hypothetical protein